MSEQEDNVGFICLKWWKELNPKIDVKSDEVTHRGDPAALARLRRAASPVIALQEPETIRLAYNLGCSNDNPERLARIGAIAGVLAHIKTNDKNQTIAKALGPQKKDEPGVMSTLRFRSLITATNSEELMREMRRAVKLLKANVNVLELANAMYYWGDQERIKWTYNYWQKGFAAPDKISAKESIEQSHNQEHA